MATSTDLNWERNLFSHWMSNAARAGVILSPAFQNLKATRAISTASVSCDSSVNSLQSSSSVSLNEDTLQEQILEPKASYEEKVDFSRTLFPASMPNKEQMLTVKDVPVQQTAMQIEPDCDKSDNLDEDCYTELLLQKLKQLKELQHQKKELLKREQTEQIQRLMEEQQHLLSMVAEQQVHTGSPATEDDTSQNYDGSTGLSPVLNISPCHNRGNRDWSSASHVSSPVEQTDYFQNLKNEQILKRNLSAEPFCKQQSLNGSFSVKNELKLEDQKIISGEKNQFPEQSLQVNHSDFEEKRNIESSKSVTAGKCSETLNAEERPIPASIQVRKQTFEEFLEEQIRLEEQRLNGKGNLKITEKATFQKPVTKRPFLKRGEGLNRFINAKYKEVNQRESKTALQPDPFEINNKSDKLQLYRKTAPSNKVSDKYAPKVGNQNAKPKKILSFPARKTTVVRNCTGKGTSSVSRQNSNERKPENREKEKNKENIMPLTKPNETGVKLPAEKAATSGITEFLCEKNQELSFELSFQKKLGSWEAEKEKEKKELDEFLFLEQAADEISFASNSSLIIRILDQGQQISSGHRLSSTPIKSKVEEQEMNELNVTAVNSINWVSQASNRGRHKDAVIGSQTPDSFKIHRNTADYEMCQTSPSAKLQDVRNSDLDEDKSDGSSDMTSETEDNFEVTIKPADEGADKITLKNKNNSPLFSRYKGQTEGPRSDTSHDLLEKDFNGDQLREINKGAETSSAYCANKNKVEFGDEISWPDFVENSNVCTQAPDSDTILNVSLSPDCSAKSETLFSDKVIKRKIAMVKKGDVLLQQNISDSEATVPPASDLMLKFFPSLKPKQKVDAQVGRDVKPNMIREEAGGETVHSQFLKEKLVELEMEIERFRAENASLSKLREEQETALESLRKEKSDFENYKLQELTRIEELKKEEARKLQKERKVFEKYAQAARSIPDKKERDEIQVLKQQIVTLQDDVKKREAKWSATHTRLRDQIDTLTRENTQLREEIVVMERFRLEAWKREEGFTNKKKNSFGSLDREESAHFPAVVPKSQSGSSVNQVEKGNKVYVKGDLSLEGLSSTKRKLAKAHNEADLDKMTMTTEGSSKSLMVNFSDGTTETSAVVTDSSDSEEVEKEASHPDGRGEKILRNGCHLTIFPNGTKKEISCDGKTTVTFFNGDVKQVLEDQRVIYYYADAKTTHTTYPSGLEILQFSNGQIEKHFPDGKKEIIFPDQTIKNVFTDGREVNIFPDGTIVHMQQDGSKIIEFSNGQQEVHTAHFKRREYPDGTIKTVYADGRQETQYASGRVRVKNKNGDIIMDTHP